MATDTPSVEDLQEIIRERDETIEVLTGMLGEYQQRHANETFAAVKAASTLTVTKTRLAAATAE